MDEYEKGKVYRFEGEFFRYEGGNPKASSSWTKVKAPNELGAINAFVNGVAQGWGPELAGLIPGGQDKDEATASLAQYRDDNMLKATGLEVAGSALPALAVLALTRGAGMPALVRSPFLRALSGPTVAAAAGGAINGAGESDDNRLGGALTGGAISALGGKALGVASKYMHGPASRAWQLVTQAIGFGGEDEMARRAAAALPEERLVDFNTKTQALGETAGTFPGDETDRFRNMLTERERGAAGRVEAGINSRMPTPMERAARTQRDLTERMRTEAAPYYEQAYKQEVPGRVVTDELRIPQFRDAYNRGRQLAFMEEGIDLPPLPENIAELARMRFGVRQIDAMKRGLDAVIESGMKGGTMSRTEARALRNRLRPMLERVDKAVPAFGTARQIYGGDAEALQLFEEGQDFLRTPADEVAERLKEMTESQRVMYRRGAAASLRNELGNVSDTRNPVQALFGKPNMRERMRVLFPDGVNAEGFLADMADEGNWHESFLLANRGSPTARRLAGQAQFGDNNIGDLASTIFSPRATAERKVRDVLGRARMGQRVAQDASQVLGKPLNSPSLLNLTARMAEEEVKRRSWLAGIAGIGGGIVGRAQ